MMMQGIYVLGMSASGVQKTPTMSRSPIPHRRSASHALAKTISIKQSQNVIVNVIPRRTIAGGRGGEISR